MKTAQSAYILMTLLLLAACSQSEVVTTYEQEAVRQVAAPQGSDERGNVPVIFNTTSASQATTRVNTTEEYLKTTDLGFGVFAYYTQNGNYPASNTTLAPNFMYNQHVTWDATAWTYSPLKYWPNDFSSGAVDNGSPAATGSQASRLSFFAYGPYVYADPSTGEAKLKDSNGDYTIGKTTGIIGFKQSSDTSDPQVRFKLGTGAEDLVQSSLKDQTKMTGSPLVNNVPTFEFAHALSGLRFEAGGNFDAVSGGQIADGTYITIESVTIASDNMPYDGWLNLNTGSWENQVTSTSSNPASTSITLDNINEQLQYKSGATLAYSSGADGEVNPGVGRNDDGTAADERTTTTLMKQVNGVDQYLMIMPSASAVTYKVTCNYHVWTFDPRNADGISKVENNVTNEVSFAPEVNKIYTITIWLGMASVGLNVTQFTNTSSHDIYFTTNEFPWELPQ